MGIFLVGKRLEDVVEIPIEIEGKRLSITPNKEDEVYIFEEDKIHYSLIPKKHFLGGKKIMFEMGVGMQDITNSYPPDENMEPVGLDFGNAYVGKVGFKFTGPGGKKQSFNYYKIDIWEELPASFKDAAFYHTYHKTKILEKGVDLIKAHNLSSIKTKTYIDQYLSDYEKKEHSDLIEKLKVLRGFNK